MRRIKNWIKFTESIRFEDSYQNLSDILESLSVLEDNLLQSIQAKEEDIFTMFNYLKDGGDVGIDDMVNNPKFNETLSKLGLRKSDIQQTKDYETFLRGNLKFVPIFKIEANDLMNPIYLLIESSKWSGVKLYRVNDNIKKFYDKLSSKTIEFIRGSDSYIYTTSNSGNNWDLQNIDNIDQDFRNHLTNDDIQNLLNKYDDISINII